MSLIFLSLKLVLFFAIFFILKPSLLGSVFIGALVMAVIKTDWKLKALSIVNFLYLVFSNEIYLDVTKYNNRLLNNLAILNMQHIKFAGLIVKSTSAFIVMAAVVILFRKLKKTNALTTFIILFFLLLVWALAVIVSSSLPITQILLWASLTIFAKYFFVILYGLWQRPTQGLSRFFTKEAFLNFPFWAQMSNYQIHNIPRGYQELETKTFPGFESKLNPALKSVSVSFALALISTIIWDLFFGTDFWYRIPSFPTFLPSLNYPVIYSIGLRNFNALHLNTFQIWSISVSWGFCFLLINAAQVFLIIGVVQICGFSLPLPINHLGRSSRFSNFLARYYFYYSDYIKNFFYYPFLIWIDKTSLRPSFKKAFAAFFGVLIGGVFAHFIIEVGREIELTSITKPILSTLMFAPYLVLLALFASISAIMPMRKAKWSKYGLIIGFFVLYSICYSVQVYFASKQLGFPTDTSDFATYLKSLINM